MNRREFSQLLCGGAVSAGFAKIALAQQQTQGTSDQQSRKPAKPEEIAMLIYPGITALDLVGPEQVFGYLGNVNIELVAKTKELVKSDTAITTQPTKTFADCVDPVDILFVGGRGRRYCRSHEGRRNAGFLVAEGKDGQAGNKRLHGIHDPWCCGSSAWLQSDVALVCARVPAAARSRPCGQPCRRRPQPDHVRRHHGGN